MSVVAEPADRSVAGSALSSCTLPKPTALLAAVALLLVLSVPAGARDLILHTQLIRMSAGWSPLICTPDGLAGPRTDGSAEILSIAVGRQIKPNIGFAVGTRVYQVFTSSDFFDNDMGVRGVLPLCFHLVGYRKTGWASSVTAYTTLDVNPALWVPMEQYARIAVGACWTGWGVLSPGIEASWRRYPIFGSGVDRLSVDVTLGLGGWLYIANSK
jgi:hypothetical protein